MNLLKLIQSTSSIETVTVATIDKIYNMFKANEDAGGTLMDANSTLEGRLYCQYLYQDAVDWLLGNKTDGTRRFPNLDITYQGAYIRFADSAVASICVTNWGDGTAITQSQASVVNTLNSKFRANTNITSFNELKYFLNVQGRNNNEGFLGCSALTNIDIRNFTGLDNNIFNGCTSLVYVGDLNITWFYGASQFRNCINLIGSSIDKPYIDLSGVNNIIGDVYSSFSHCSSIKRVILPQNFTFTIKCCFEYCTSLITVDNSDKLSFVRQGMFSNCTAIQSIILSNLCTYIETNAFIGCSSLTNIGDLSGVITLGGSCFRGCSSLVNLNLIGVTSWEGDDIFRDCTALTNALFSTEFTTTSWGNNVFYNCSSLISLGDLSALTKISGSNCFYNCTSLTSVNFTSVLNSLGGGSFNGCTSLTSVGNISGLIGIENSVFQNCRNLGPSLDVSNVTYIRYYAFYGCTSLQTLNLSTKCTFLGDNCFSGCTALTSVGDLSCVTSAEGTTFANCTSIQSLNFSNKLITLTGSCFSGCTALTSVGDLSSVTTVGPACFRNTKLTNLNLPSITSIAREACSGMSLLSNVSFGSGLTKIGSQLLANCPVLRYAIFNSTSVPTMDGGMLNSTPNCKIYVPDSSVSAYKAATNWSSYASRIFSLTQFAVDFPNG